jgi:hypothetical protein
MKRVKTNPTYILIFSYSARPLSTIKNLSATITRRNKIYGRFFEEDFWLFTKNLYKRILKRGFLKPLMVRTVKNF